MKNLLGLLCALGLLTACAPPTPPPRLDPGWASDARQLVEILDRTHPNPWRRATRAEVLGAALRAAEPGLTDAVRRGRLRAALALLREGHTRADLWSTNPSVLPLELGRFRDGLAVTRVFEGRWTLPPGLTPEGLLACRLTGIGGEAVGSFQVRASAYASAENPEGLLAATPALAVDGDVLAALGLVGADSGVELEFVTPDQKSWKVRAWPSAPGAGQPNVRAGLTGPATWQRRGDPLWNETSQAGAVVRLVYNVCQEGPDFGPVTRAFLAAAGRPEARTVLVDLRTNGGGDSWPFTSKLLPGLRALAGSKTLVVLAGPDTFSSAIIALAELRSIGAVFVGEATSEGLNSYGEVKGFRLDHSGFSFITSSKHFELEAGHPEGEALSPDRQVTTTSADFAAGRDPVLEVAEAL